MLDHLPLPRHRFQRLGHVLAQLVQHAAAAWAGRRHRIDHALARQMLGQRPAGRLAPRKGLHALRRRLVDRRRRLGLGLILLELEQLQLELVEQRAALRRLTELRAAAGRSDARASRSARRARAPAPPPLDVPTARPAASSSVSRRRRLGGGRRHSAICGTPTS
jgi:hypothetical protein